MTVLARWQNFYVIVGSSAGALIGLQFVVLTLISRTPARANATAGSAFATPSIVHFATALGLSAIFCAPWEGVGAFTGVWTVIGVGGVVYALLVLRKVRIQSAYRPQFEDWLFHVILPLAAYATLAASAFAARSHMREALFGAAGAALLLLFIGIHNAWDAVTWHVFVRSKDDEQQP